MEALMDASYARMKKKFFEKATDYGTDGDVLADFKDEARDLEVSWFKVWHVFGYKHWRAVTAFARRGQVESEPIQGRIEDVIGYQFLLLGLIEDAKAEVSDFDPAHRVGGVDALSSRLALEDASFLSQQARRGGAPE
jgi:hypothetical protein